MSPKKAHGGRALSPGSANPNISWQSEQVALHVCCYLCFIWSLQIPAPLLPEPTSHLNALSSCCNWGFSPLKTLIKKNIISSQLLLIFTSFQQLVPWQMKCQNISKLKPYSSHTPHPQQDGLSLLAPSTRLKKLKIARWQLTETLRRMGWVPAGSVFWMDSKWGSQPAVLWPRKGFH